MELEKYDNDGWGISRDGFRKIIDIFENTNFNEFETFNILEFGSGVSTEFFVDYVQEKNLKNVHIISFENDSNYMTKAKHQQLDVKFRRLVTCSDVDYDEMFKNKEYNPARISYLIHEPTSRQKNCFYQILENDIPNVVDFVLLDGPSGNGRNFAFLHLINKLKTGTIVFIDDYDHYDFYEKFQLFFDAEEIFRQTLDNDRFLILKVK